VAKIIEIVFNLIGWSWYGASRCNFICTHVLNYLSSFLNSCNYFLKYEALKQLKEFNPKGRFWVKADAFDLKVALQESVKGLWNGDVDLGDGKLEELRRDYDNRREDCKIKESDGNRMALEKKLRQQCDNLQLDIKFLSSGLVLAEQQYQKKFNAPNSSEKLLKTLCFWGWQMQFNPYIWKNE